MNEETRAATDPAAVAAALVARMRRAAAAR